jgi:RecG-like helicase
MIHMLVFEDNNHLVSKLVSTLAQDEEKQEDESKVLCDGVAGGDVGSGKAVVAVKGRTCFEDAFALEGR